MIESHSKDILQELSPLSEEDCLYVIERKKKEFTFPIHCHSEFELNYIENAVGATRIVGDSIEEITTYDLVLITGENLEHAWENGTMHITNTPLKANTTQHEIREITIQFSSKLLNPDLLDKKQFRSIQDMFKEAQKGLSFPLATILRVRSLLNSLTYEDQGFYSVINFLSLMYELSLCRDARVLSSSSFAQNVQAIDSRRIKLVDEFLQKNYSREVTVAEVATIVNMNSGSFSRFFKLRSGKNFTDYLTDIRIGHVIRILVNSNKTISEVCYECGFNNISNFNRIFKKRKGCSPREFRELYKKKRMIF